MITTARKRAICVSVDWLSTSLALLLFNIVRFYSSESAYGGSSLSSFLLSDTIVVEQILFPLVMLALYYMSGYYSNVFTRSRVSEFTVTAATSLLGILLFGFISVINGAPAARTTETMLVLGLMLFVMVYIPRLCMTTLTMKRISRGKIYFPTAIIGAGARPEKFDEFAHRRVPLIGVLPVTEIYSDNIVPPGRKGYPINQITEAFVTHGIERIILLPEPSWEQTQLIINRLYTYATPIYVSAVELPSYMLNNRLISFTADPLIDVTHSNLHPSAVSIKRVFDICASAVMLVLTALPMLILTIAIKATGPGPAIYSQKRLGRNRKPFTIYKLRTMTADSESDGKPKLSYPDDPRITPLGRILRKYRIDELPQFFNVLRGDMSIVGPRPERPEFVEQIVEMAPQYTLLHNVRPGITSLGMVKYGYASSVTQMVERMRFDLIYLQNFSLINDIKIIMYTFATVFLGKGI